eukprot:2310126-Rhodomonas_salina.2
MSALGTRMSSKHMCISIQFNFEQVTAAENFSGGVDSTIIRPGRDSVMQTSILHFVSLNHLDSARKRAARLRLRAEETRSDEPGDVEIVDLCTQQPEPLLENSEVIVVLSSQENGPSQVLTPTTQDQPFSTQSSIDDTVLLDPARELQISTSQEDAMIDVGKLNRSGAALL